MRGAQELAAGLLVAVVLFARPAAAQERKAIIVVDSRPIQEHVTIRGTEYVSQEALLQRLGFEWSLRRNELELREGDRGGPRVAAEELVIKLGDLSLAVTGERRRDGVYVPLVTVLPFLGHRADHDAASDTIAIVSARPAAPARVRPTERAEPDPAARERGRIRLPPHRTGEAPPADPAGGRVPVAQAAPELAANAPPAMYFVTLFVEDIPFPDVPTSWTTARGVDQPHTLMFRWRTHEAAAASARWRVRREGAHPLFAPTWEGSAGSAPEPGAEAFFTIDFGKILPATPPAEPVSYIVRVDAYSLARAGTTSEPVATTSTVRVVHQKTPFVRPSISAGDSGGDVAIAQALGRGRDVRPGVPPGTQRRSPAARALGRGRTHTRSRV